MPLGVMKKRDLLKDSNIPAVPVSVNAEPLTGHALGRARVTGALP